jgi:hypothetical protein
MMDKFPITVRKENEVYHFDVIDYVHHTGERCQFEVYQNGRLVASFEPDAQEHLQVCKNSGNLDEALLHLVADEIETYDW